MGGTSSEQDVVRILMTMAMSAAFSAVFASSAWCDDGRRLELGAGASVTYGAAYWGAAKDKVSVIPLGYISYHDRNFDVLPTGLYDVPGGDRSTFGYGLSVDLHGKIDSEDRLFLGKIDYVGEIGPQVTFALLADGQSRVQLSMAARAAFEWQQGYFGYVLEPELGYFVKLSSRARIGSTFSARFGFDGYNQRYYSAPGFEAPDGLIGVEFALKGVYDLSDRVRIGGKIGAVSVAGSEIRQSPLVQSDWDATARASLTYVLYRDGGG